MIFSIILPLILGLPTIYFFLWIKNTQYRNAINKFPGPTTAPLVGNALQMGHEPADNLRQNMKWAKEYKEGVFRTWVGPFAIITVYKAELLECVLSTSNPKKSVFYKFVRPWLRNGLLLSFGPKWQKRRKMLTPTFHYSILEDFMSVFHQQSEKLVRILKEKGHEEFDVCPYITRCALDVMCFSLYSISEFLCIVTAMGADVNSHDGLNEYVDAIHKIGDMIVGRTSMPWNYYDFIFNLTSLGKEQEKVLKVLHGFTNRIIRKRWREYEEKLVRGEKLGQEEFDEFGKKKRLAFLDLLIQNSMADQSMTITDIQEEVDTFMFEGHDTVTSAIGWGIYNLGRHKEWQEKLREEINKFSGDGDRRLSMNEINELKLLDCFLKESMRLFSTAPFFSREITEECKIGPYHCPKGATVQVLVSALHRDLQYFPDPEKFDPERWMTEDIAKRHPFCYAPFSSGLRNCIGQRFAQLEWKVTIINMVKNFYITCDHDLDDFKDQDGVMVLRPSRGIHIKLQPTH